MVTLRIAVNRRSRRAALASAMLALLVATVVRAQEEARPDTATAHPSSEDPRTVRARMLFQEGVLLARQERWAEALAKFRESASLVERASTVLNIATALQRLGRPRECIAAVERYLAVSDPIADAEARERAVELRRAMQDAIARVVLAVLPVDAEILVNGVPSALAEDGSVELDPGMHAFVVQRDGYLPARFSVELAPGARISRSVTLAPRPAEPARLSVSTQVVGARIEVDGEVVGTDEVDLELMPGPHTVRVSREGWEPYQRALVIEAGTRARIDAQLSRPGTCRSVECEPAFWIVGGVLLAGAAAATVGIVFATATTAPPYGGTANFHVDALRF